MSNQSEESIPTEKKSAGQSLKDFFYEFLTIKDGVDVYGTIKNIKTDIEFKGYSVWILVCSIFIASIGLNTNSTAVVIGAMLISPLMGPILGIGLSVGINDFQVLVKSLKNFAVMVVVSLLSSTLYFLIFPSFGIQSEILARTQPTSLDVLIAIFGGTAGIIAASRKEKSNAIPGVAIATALMPPLCTAGFGLAEGNFQFFFGAMYLFLLNSIFICLSTYLFIKYFKFPLKEFVDPKRERRVKSWIFIFVLLVIIPSGILFVGVLRESYFKNKAELFLSENMRMEGSVLIKHELNYSDTLSTINLYLMGDGIDNKIKENLNMSLAKYGLNNSFWVKKTALVFHESRDNSKELLGKISNLESKFFQNSYERNIELLKEKNQIIEKFQKEALLKKEDEIPYAQVIDEIKINYPKIGNVSMSNMITKNDSGLLDTTFTVLVNKKFKSTETLQQWLNVRLNKKKVLVVRLN